MTRAVRCGVNGVGAAVAVLLLAVALFGCKRLTPVVQDEVDPPEMLHTVSWAGVLPSGSFRAQTPERITLLHSGFTPAVGVNMLAYMKSLQQEDRRKGWGDLGAHFYIDPWGTIYQGRRIVLKGRIDDENRWDTTGHIFIMLLGDYNTSVPSEPFQEQCIALLGWLCQHHEIPLEHLKGLDAYMVTDSPGLHMTAWLESPEFTVRIREYLGIPLPTPTPTPVGTPSGTDAK